MDDCCNTAADGAGACKACGQTGPIVGPAPVRTHHPAADGGPWQFCPTPSCPVAFHLGGDTVHVDRLIARVGSKGADAPEPECFCFGHTREDLAADLAAHDDTSTIKTSIKAAVADGLCACQHLNPGGGCCLADIHRTIKAIRADAPAATAYR